jgi:hypothetical protein
MTSIPQNKNELIEAIESNYQKLQTDLVDIPDNLTCKKELDGHAKGTKMSVCDLVAYLVGWGNLVLKWHERRNKGLKVDFPETGYSWGELGKLAQKFYADYQNDDYQTLLKKLDKSKNDILKLITKYTNQQMYGVNWEGRWTMGRFIQLNTSSPYKNARNRIRRWKKQKGLT